MFHFVATNQIGTHLFADLCHQARTLNLATSVITTPVKALVVFTHYDTRWSAISKIMILDRKFVHLCFMLLVALNE